MTREILGHFFNTLAADDKYSVCNSEILRQPIQMHFSKIQKYFSQLFTALLKYTSSFKNFEKKDDPHSLCISEVEDGERLG